MKETGKVEEIVEDIADVNDVVDEVLGDLPDVGESTLSEEDQLSVSMLEKAGNVFEMLQALNDVASRVRMTTSSYVNASTVAERDAFNSALKAQEPLLDGILTQLGMRDNPTGKDTFETRLYKERDDLGVKAEKLKFALENNKIPAKELAICKGQLKQMEAYLETLNKRINRLPKAKEVKDA